MKEYPGTTGLILNEPLLWEKGAKGRTGFSLPRPEVDASPLDDELVGDGPDFPDLSELDVIRHFTRLSLLTARRPFIARCRFLMRP